MNPPGDIKNDPGKDGGPLQGRPAFFDPLCVRTLTMSVRGHIFDAGW